MSAESATVLLVEDDPTQVRVIGEILRRVTGISVDLRTADRLSQALDILASGGIDLVLLDLGLPDSQGLDTFTALNGVHPQVPVIVMSGLDDEALAVQTVQRGAQDYIVKGQMTSRGIVRAVRYALERTRASLAVLDFQQTVNVFLSITPDAVILIDPAGTILETNRVAAQHLGCPIEKLTGRSFYEIPSPLSTAVTRQCVAQVVESGKPFSLIAQEGPQWYEHNLYPLFLAQKRVDRIVIYSRDITAFKQVERDLEARVRERTAELNRLNLALRSEIAERSKLEESLVEAEQRYHTLFEQSADAIMLIDPDDGRLVDFNTRTCEYLGYSREDLAGMKVADIEAAAPPDDVLRNLQRLAREGGTFETRHRTRKGEVRDMLIHSRPVSIGGRILINAICIDITEQKRLESELRKAIARLEEHNRTKSQFVTNVSHDLKTPLASMSYALENLRQGIVGRMDRRVSGYTDMLYEDIQRLSRTVDDILDISRIEAGKFTLTRMRFPFARFVRRSVESIRIQARTHQLHLNVKIPDGCGFIDGDPHKLERLILNVMHNAIKFTPAHGQIDVRMGSRPDWPGFVALDVIDNGPGIDPQHLHRVTERYYRVGDQVTGTGIGLTICKEILELHGGRLDLKSPPSDGTHGLQVSIGLPRAEPLRAVLVNPDASARAAQQAALEGDGYRVDAAAAAEDAFRIIAQAPGPEALVLDLAVGETQSTGLIIRVRTLPGMANLPIVITTEHPPDAARQRILETLGVPVLNGSAGVDKILYALEAEIIEKHYAAAAGEAPGEV